MPWFNWIKSKKYLLFAILLLFFLRVPSLFEVEWYGDEGIYASIANGLAHGQTLYKEAWDHKPPIIFVVYYIFYVLPGKHVLGIKLVNIALGVISVMLFDKIASNYTALTARARSVCVLLYSVILGLPVLEGNILNAENVFVPLCMAALWLAFSKPLTNKLAIICGLLLGFAIMTKYQSGVELVPIIYLFYKQRPRKVIWLSLFAGVSLPWILLLVAFGAQGALGDFVYANFTFNLKYLASIPGKGTNWWLLLLKICLLLSAGFVMAKKRSGFLGIWVFVNIAVILLPNRFYLHYALPLITPLLLWLVVEFGHAKRLAVTFLLVIGALSHWSYWGDLYCNYFRLPLGKTSEEADYQKMLKVSAYLRGEVSVFVWANYPWSFAVSNSKIEYKYTAYHHMNSEHANEVVEMFANRPPKKIIVDSKYLVHADIASYIASRCIISSDLGSDLQIYECR